MLFEAESTGLHDACGYCYHFRTDYSSEVPGSTKSSNFLPVPSLRICSQNYSFDLRPLFYSSNAPFSEYFYITGKSYCSENTVNFSSGCHSGYKLKLCSNTHPRVLTAQTTALNSCINSLPHTSATRTSVICHCRQSR